MFIPVLIIENNRSEFFSLSKNINNEFWIWKRKCESRNFHFLIKEQYPMFFINKYMSGIFITAHGNYS